MIFEHLKSGIQVNATHLIITKNLEEIFVLSTPDKNNLSHTIIDSHNLVSVEDLSFITHFDLNELTNKVMSLVDLDDEPKEGSFLPPQGFIIADVESTIDSPQFTYKGRLKGVIDGVVTSAYYHSYGFSLSVNKQPNSDDFIYVSKRSIKHGLRSTRTTNSVDPLALSLFIGEYHD